MPSEVLLPFDDENERTIAPHKSAYTLADVLAPGEAPLFSDLPRIKLPAGGGTTWELPDGSAQKSLDVIIIHRQLTRAYWAAKFDGGSEPPQCVSQDAVIGIGDPGGECATCPNAQFGSSGRGQACRLITRLFIVNQPGDMPTMLSLPPSAANIARQYIVNVLMTRNLPYWAVLTSITLTKRTNAQGIAYSAPVFRIIDVLDEESVEIVEQMRAALVPQLSAIRAGADAV